MKEGRGTSNPSLGRGVVWGDDSGTETARKAGSAAYLLPDEFWLVAV